MHNLIRISFVFLLLLQLENSTIGQNLKDAKKQQKKELKAQKKIEQELRARHLSRPAIDYFPGDKNIVGQSLINAASASGFQFVGFQEAINVFGAETRQAAIFSAEPSWGESAAVRFGIGLRGGRALNNPVKVIAFAVNETVLKSVAVEGKIGMYTLTTSGWYYEDLTSSDGYRDTLDSIISKAKSMSRNIADQIVSASQSSQELYEKIKVGMNVEEVLKMLGKGRIVSDSETETSRTIEYEWIFGNNKINSTFENDRLIKKSQIIGN